MSTEMNEPDRRPEPVAAQAAVTGRAAGQETREELIERLSKIPLPPSPTDQPFKVRTR